MSSISRFTWPKHVNTKRDPPSPPTPAPDHRLLKICLSVAGAATGIVIIYTIFFFALRWRKAHAAKRSTDTEAEVKSIELIDHDPSPYIGYGHPGGDVSDSRSARMSCELPVHYSGVRKEDGKLEFEEVDLGGKRSRE
jgi:hypothetical protein